MTHLSSAELAQFFFVIGFIVLIAKLIGKLCQKIKCPVVVGELLTGIILGPSLLGSLHPQISQFLLPKTGHITFAFDSLFNISIVLLLFAAGLEINIHQVMENKKATFLTCIMGTLIPFAMGFSAVYYFPHVFNLNTLSPNNLIMTATFIGIALAISALPVLARILAEIKLLHTYIGVVIMSAVFVTDIIAWLVFSTLVSLHSQGKLNVDILFGFTLLLFFILFMLTAGKYFSDKYLIKHVKKTGDNLAIILGICLLCAAFVEFAGFHASFGAFIAGIALNNLITTKQKLKKVVEHFVNSFFAPIFFVSIGLKLNFIKNFDFVIICSVLFLAFVSKTIGASLGAYLAGIKPRSALAIGCGMNARGAMEIILCTIALGVGLIPENIFVAFVIMAILTSLASGPLMLWLLNEKPVAAVNLGEQ